MSNSSIEWTDRTWNPVTGCTEVSPGCDHCYAKVMAGRLQAMGQAHYANGFQVTLHEDFLDLPFTWKKPQMVFVNSMSDLFHKDVPDSFILQAFAVMAMTPRHTYQVLTKRPSRLVNTSLTEKILENVYNHTGKKAWPSHIWLGTSVESQDYTWRIDKIRQVPAPIRFISAEPLLGPMALDLRGISWLIAGAESGRSARPMDEDWVRCLRNQCIDMQVAFFYKQNAVNGRKVPTPELDGRTWKQFPPGTWEVAE